MAQIFFVAPGYCSRHPARCPRLTLDHCCRCHMLHHRHQNWNHQHWFHVLFADESIDPERMIEYIGWDQCLWFQFWGLSAHMRRQQRGPGPRDIQLPLNVVGPCGPIQGVQFTWSAPPWSYTVHRKKALLSHAKEKGTVFFWCDHLQ